VEAGNRNKVPSMYQRTALIGEDGKPIIQEYKLNPMDERRRFLHEQHESMAINENGYVVLPFDNEPQTSLVREQVHNGMLGVNTTPGQHLTTAGLHPRSSKDFFERNKLNNDRKLNHLGRHAHKAFWVNRPAEKYYGGSQSVITSPNSLPPQMSQINSQ